MGSNLGARVLLIMASLAAALGYTAWTANRTVLDPGSTRTAAQAIVTTPAVQRSLTTQVSKQVDEVLAQHGVDQQVRTAVGQALRDPAVSAAFADAVASIHRALLGDGSGKVTIDTAALTNAVHSALAKQSPKLAKQFSTQTKARPLTVDIGKDKIPNLSKLRDDMNIATLLGFAAALLLGALSLLLWHERKAANLVGRRIAYLAITPLLVFLVLPLVASHFSGTAPEVIGAVMRSYRGRVLPSAFAFIVVGLVVVLASILWPRRSLAVEPVAASPTRSEPSLPSPLAPAISSPSGTGEKLYL